MPRPLALCKHVMAAPEVRSDLSHAACSARLKCLGPLALYEHVTTAPNARSEQPHAVCRAWVRIESAMKTNTSIITLLFFQVATSTSIWASGPDGQSRKGLAAQLQVG